MSRSSAAGVAVVGEALIDLVPGSGPAEFVARPGGSPYNVAIGLARLGVADLTVRPAGRQRVRTAAAFARARFGYLDCRSPRPRRNRPPWPSSASIPRRARPTTSTSTARPTGNGPPLNWPRYRRRRRWCISARWPHGRRPARRPCCLRCGRPGTRDGWSVSTRTCVRPYSVRRRPRGPLIEAGVAVAHLVKASTDDVSWLYPDVAPASVASGWIALGAAVVVITDGPAGAWEFTAADSWQRPGRVIDLVDTVGAGDAFTSGLLAGLLRREITSPGALAAASR